MIGAAHRRIGAAALAIAASFLTGCETLDAAAVAETHRLEEGEFYVSPGGPSLSTVSSAVIRPARRTSTSAARTANWRRRRPGSR